MRFSRAGRAANTIEFSSTEMEEQTFEVDASKFKGVKNNFFVAVREATDFYVDAWKFSDENSTGIVEIENGTPTKVQRYDLSGRRLSEAQQHRGIVIEQYTDENGVKHSRKTLSE